MKHGTGRLNWKDKYQEVIQSLLPSDGMEQMNEQHLQKSPGSRSQTAYPLPLWAYWNNEYRISNKEPQNVEGR